MKLKKNTVQANNSWLGLFNQKDYEFFTLEYWQSYYKELKPPEVQHFLAIWIVENEEQEKLGRDVDTIWDALADAGGFYEIATLFSFMLVMHFQKFYYVK